MEKERFDFFRTGSGWARVGLADQTDIDNARTAGWWPVVRACGNGAGAAAHRLSRWAADAGRPCYRNDSGEAEYNLCARVVPVDSVDDAAAIVAAVDGAGVLGAIFGSSESCHLVALCPKEAQRIRDPRNLT
jgi:hypothetical protein